MAGDWIKMRADLLTHPKVVRMASALKADRLRVVGGLFAVWCLFDAHSVDGQLEGYTDEVLDSLVGFPGFANAMRAIGWLEFDGDSLVTPRFNEHNGQSAKRRATEAQRKREERKTSAYGADKKRTREEKRREEKNTDTATSVAPPDGVAVKVWQDFLKIRKAKRAPITETAIDGIRVEAGKAGYSLNQALETCCKRGWQGFEADWVSGKPALVANGSVLAGAI